MTTRWPLIVLLWGIGVLAAAQLAKIAVLAPDLRQTFDLTLPQVGLLISLLEVGGALFGFVAGVMIGRAGARRFLIVGLVTLALTGAIEAVAPDAGILFTARACEGIGYVLTVIAAPTMIVALSTERERGAALALWSTFVPLGVALGSGVTGIAEGWIGTPGVLLLWAGSFAIVLPSALRLPSAPPAQSRKLKLPATAAWLSTGAFGIYTTLVCALTALLPIYLIEDLHAAVMVASGVTAFVSAAALPGCVAMIFIMRRGLPGSRRSLAITVPALIASAGLGAMIFQDGILIGPPVTTTGTLAGLTVLLGGVVPPLLFARLPLLSDAGTGDDPKLAVAQGLLTQFGAGGALIGPPLGGLIVGSWGWSALGPAIAGLTIVMLTALVLAEWVASRPMPTLSEQRPSSSAAC